MHSRKELSNIATFSVLLLLRGACLPDYFLLFNCLPERLATCVLSICGRDSRKFTYCGFYGPSFAIRQQVLFFFFFLSLSKEIAEWNGSD